MVFKMIFIPLMLMVFSGCLAEKKEVDLLDQKITTLKGELEKLNRDLGDFKYMAIDPRIKFAVSDPVFSKQKYDVGSPEVKFKLSAFQTNAEFPLACSEQFGCNHGNEWFVGHYLFRKR